MDGSLQKLLFLGKGVLKIYSKFTGICCILQKIFSQEHLWVAASKNYKLILKLKKSILLSILLSPINEIQISKLPKQGKMMLPKLLLLSSMKVLSGLEKAIQIARASWVPRNKNINLAKLTTRAEVSLSSFIGGRQSSYYHSQKQSSRVAL